MKEELESVEPELTGKQKRFCEEYIFDWNGARAARAAGYSVDTAKEIASENLTKPNIKAYIEELKTKTAELAGVSALRVAVEYAKIAFSSAAFLREDWFTEKEWDELTDDEKAIISEIQVTTKSIGDNKGSPIVEKMLKFKTYDKQKALAELKKMFGYDTVSKLEIGLADDTQHIQIVRLPDNNRGKFPKE